VLAASYRPVIGRAEDADRADGALADGAPKVA